MMLYAQFLAGVPMNSAIALPMMLGHIRAHDCGHLLHSMQTPVALPAHSSLAKMSIPLEPGRIFFTRRMVNTFYTSIGLSMRRGTGCFSKNAKPAEVDSLRNLMMHRMLFMMVKNGVKRSMVFQMDETGVSLLLFSKRGRAQQGVSEVRFHGFDEKRQFTLTPVIDGNSKLVHPTQMIWGGQEYKKGFTGNQDHRLDRATPSKTVQHENAKFLSHTQTDSHWCTLGSLKLLIVALALHVAAVVAADGDLTESSHWILVLDCYATHISEEFIHWCKAEYPLLILLYIPAACTNWLQPLDISFNGTFKFLLRNYAGTWLAEMVTEQLRQANNDPSQVKLDVRLSVLKKPFAQWNAAVLEEMDKRTAVIKRGWDESGMGGGMDLVESKGADCEEFRVAERMEAAGKLFEKFTMKKKAELAEALLTARFKDLMGDEVDAEVQRAAEEDRAFTMDELQQLDNMYPEEGAAAEGGGAALDDFTWQQPEYSALMPTLQAQGRQIHLQSLQLADETAMVDQTRGNGPPTNKRTKKK